MCPKTNNDDFAASDVIDRVYNYFKSRNPVFPLLQDSQVQDILYDYYDSHEGRRYVIGFNYNELVLVNNYLVVKGVGFGTRLSSVGDCLLIITLKKGNKLDNFIKEHDRIKTRKYHVLYSYRGKLHTPYKLISGVNSEISYVLASADKGFLPSVEIGWLRYYVSTVSRHLYLVDDLVTAFECSLGLSSKKIKKLSQEAELARRRLMLMESPKEGVFDDIRSLIDTLEKRVKLFGEPEFIPTLDFLRSEIGKLGSVVDS